MTLLYYTCTCFHVFIKLQPCWCSQMSEITLVISQCHVPNSYFFKLLFCYLMSPSFTLYLCFMSKIQCNTTALPKYHLKCFFQCLHTIFTDMRSTDYYYFHECGICASAVDSWVPVSTSKGCFHSLSFCVCSETLL